MRTRYFGAWCENCSTRLSLETEENGEDEARGVDAVFPGLDLEKNTPCPICGKMLHCCDLLVGLDYLPVGGWKKEDEPRLQREFQAEYRKRCAAHASKVR